MVLRQDIASLALGMTGDGISRDPGRVPPPMAVRIPHTAPTRLMWWRLCSRVCAAVDITVVAVMVVLCVVSMVGSAVSWPTDVVLIKPEPITIGSPSAVIVLIAVLWLCVSVGMLVSWRGGRWVGIDMRRSGIDVQPLSRRGRFAFGLVNVLVLAVMAGNFFAGVAEGEARVLPGSGYEVRTAELNGGAWTTVSAGDYQVWQARFLREEGLGFLVAGSVLSLIELGILRMHRRVAEYPLTLPSITAFM